MDLAIAREVNPVQRHVRQQTSMPQYIMLWGLTTTLNYTTSKDDPFRYAMENRFQSYKGKNEFNGDCHFSRVAKLVITNSDRD